jgi:hypothetical protein
MAGEQLIDITPPPRFAWGPDPLWWWVLGGITLLAALTLFLINRTRQQSGFKALNHLKLLEIRNVDSLRLAIRIFIAALLKINANSMSAKELRSLSKRYSPGEPLPKLVELLEELDTKTLSGCEIDLKSAHQKAVLLAEQANKQQIGGQV